MFISDREDLLADWDWELNSGLDIKPSEITLGSRARVYWKCHVCKGRWDTVVKERRGCPYCSGFKALPGFNDLETLRPDLANQWAYDANNGLTPQDVTLGSQKRIYWKCDKGHVWDALVRSRVKGQGCPYCNNRRVLTGYNDLATINPTLAAEWHYQKNNAYTPQTITAGSKEKVWWRCAACGYEWQASVSNRNRGNGCPACAHYVVHEKVNDLETRYPEIASEWDYDGNNMKPSQIAPFSNYRASWICPKGHIFKAVVSDRVKGSNCPVCSKERRISFPEKALFYYISKEFNGVIANYRASWLGSFELDIYMPENRIGIEYDGVYGHSGKRGVERDIRKNEICANNGVVLLRIREANCPPTSSSIDYIMDTDEKLETAIFAAIDILYNLLGEGGHEHRTAIDIARDSGDIYSLIDYSEKQESLWNKMPEVAKLWHPTKNGHLTAKSVSWMSSKTVWWSGPCGHEWRSSVSNEIRRGNCPYCIGKRILVGFNDLKTTHPELAAEWDYEKNAPLTPEAISAGSGKKLWWKCQNGHSWQAIVSSRKQGRGCPVCSNRVVLKGYNDVASRQEILADWDYERNPDAPDTVCIGTDKEVWWKCHVCGSRWKVAVADRKNGSGCPECAKLKRQVSVAATYVKRSGSLSDKRPDLVEEWDWQRNKRFLPSDVTCGSEKKAWWICKKCGYKWQASIVSRNRKEGGGCPNCAIQSASIKRSQSLLEHREPLSVTHPEIAEEWAYERNKSLTPDMITAGSGRRVWWKCAICGSYWDAVIVERTRRKASPNCPKCRRRRYEAEKKNSKSRHTPERSH